MSCLNHPHWSLLTSPEIENENPYHAVEIMNYATEWLEKHGRRKRFLDRDASARLQAVEWGSDNHNGRCPIDGDVDSMYCDSFGGFTVVKAADRSPRAIVRL